MTAYEILDQSLADTWIATAVANRVAALLPIFFGHSAGLRNTDTFDVKQGVELVWRELAGQPRAETLRRAVRSRLPDMRRVADEYRLHGGTIAASAINAVDALTDEQITARDRLCRTLAAALEVALGLDASTVPPPDGYHNWTTYELHGQAELFELLSRGLELPATLTVSDLRMKSGVQSMDYRKAMASFLRNGSSY